MLLLQTRLNVDWDGGPFEYTCYQAQKFVPLNIQPILRLDNIPEEYSVRTNFLVFCAQIYDTL